MKIKQEQILITLLGLGWDAVTATVTETKHYKDEYK